MSISGITSSVNPYPTVPANSNQSASTNPPAQLPETVKHAGGGHHGGHHATDALTSSTTTSATSSTSSVQSQSAATTTNSATPNGSTQPYSLYGPAGSNIDTTA